MSEISQSLRIKYNGRKVILNLYKNQTVMIEKVAAKR